jgi:signal transduction histidine kinase
MRSLRVRVLVGAVLWTLGLFFIVTIIFTFSARARESAMVVHRHTLISAVLAIVAMVTGFVVVRDVLAPLYGMRARLGRVRTGAASQLEGGYPSEIQPLVDDLNALLAQKEEAVRRANAKAGDLAHGLKTPLAVLSNEAERLASSGDQGLAATMTQQVALMRRQVEYHLAHARAAAAGTTHRVRCAVPASVDGLIRTLTRLHASRGLTIESQVLPDAAVQCGREDLDEMLGNLIDNACKWASGRVLVGSSAASSGLAITVDDDGPGLDRSSREVVLQRGVRADEAVPGSGLGLAIVRDIAELYGGSITLEDSPLGGLRARLTLPSGRRE